MNDRTGGDIEIRRLRTNEEYRACVEIQKLVWGESFSERVPLAILKVGQRIGGVTAGAFDPGGRMLGFVFGITGLAEGRPVHWSDMLAVLPSARGLGLGRRLKEFQRAELLPLGVELMYWTFDPLVARNAHLNLRVLRAVAVEYAPDMYGRETSSELHRGVGTDRLVVAWHLRPAREHDRREEPSVGGYGALVASDAGMPRVEAELLHDRPPGVTIEIPEDIEALQRDSLDLAATWREVTRRGFLAATRAGYRVTDFRRAHADEPGIYLLTRDT